VREQTGESGLLQLPSRALHHDLGGDLVESLARDVSLQLGLDVLGGFAGANLRSRLGHVDLRTISVIRLARRPIRAKRPTA
jgi:hypothetical protein